MRRLFILIVALIVLGGPIALSLARPEIIPASALAPYPANLDNGRSTFFAGGCASCHATPDQDDPVRLGGGRALPSPFGTFRVPNISSHTRDGIGAWTEVQFVNAVLRGASPDREHYFPAFPYTSYGRMRLADARDLFAFMRTLPAVEGRAPAHEVPFPFNLRVGVGLWKFRYFDGRTFRPDAGKSEPWNRGAYLVEALGHCAECHSPRDFMGGIIPEQRFAGGPNPTGEGSIPNITQHENGLAKWSEAEIEHLLETGNTPGGDSVGGDMRLVIRNTSQLSAVDRKAMAHYLKSLPPQPGPGR
jgi:mono/diheme cytochrome c family protein